MATPVLVCLEYWGHGLQVDFRKQVPQCSLERSSGRIRLGHVSGPAGPAEMGATMLLIAVIVDGRRPGHSQAEPN